MNLRQSQREMKSKEVELGSHSWMVCLAAELFLNGCFSDIVFVRWSWAVIAGWIVVLLSCSSTADPSDSVTLFYPAIERGSKYTSCFALVGSPLLYYLLFCYYYLLFCRWMAVFSVFTGVGAQGQAIHMYPTPTPTPPPVPSP